jgi:hypothetical protein
MSKIDQAFHASFKPKWAGTGKLLHRTSSLSSPTDESSMWNDTELMTDAGGKLVVSSLNGDGKEVSNKMVLW